MSSYALLIGISQFSDPKLGKLNAPRSDVEALARVLEDPERGGFTSVTTCIDQELQVIRDQVASLLDERNPDDLVLLYYSGHGILTKGQRLFLATGQTLFDRPQARSLAALEMRDMLEQSRAGKQVVILDCCHSGAFGEGSKGAVQAVNPDTFGDSEGQFVLTATDALQLAYDSSSVLKESSAPQALSRFTRWLVDAIGKGEAAPDSEHITLDAVFDYLSRRARSEAAGMTPKLFVKRSSGKMVIAKNPLAAPAALPEDIIIGLDADEWQVRRDTVTKLGKLAGQPRYRDLVERGITDRIGLERDVDVRAAMLALLRKLGSDAPAPSDPAGPSAPGLPQNDAPAVSHPAAQSAPGLPRPDAPHSDQPPVQDPATGGGVEKRLPDTAVTRSQLFSGITVLLSSPIQVVLYPIAGSAGLFAGVTIYLLTYYFMRWDAVASEVVSALAVLAFTLERLPVEFRFAESHPLYPKIRHWIRLALVNGGVVSLLMLGYAEDAKQFPELEDQTSSLGNLVNLIFGFSIMAAVFVVVPMHFVLRWVAARRVWDGIIQTVLDLRKA